METLLRFSRVDVTHAPNVSNAFHPQFRVAKLPSQITHVVIYAAIQHSEATPKRQLCDLVTRENFACGANEESQDIELGSR
jgi:hypothetical protein